MQAITISQLQQSLQTYLLAAHQGEQILILDGATVVAQLLPYMKPAEGANPPPPPIEDVEPEDMPPPPAGPTPAERFSGYFNAKDVGQALEGLAQIESAIIMAKKDHEQLLQTARDWENKAIILMKDQPAAEGAPVAEEVQATVMEVLKEREKATLRADQKLREISELEYLKAQLQEQADRLRELKATYRRRIVEMPDSEETIAMIERMRAKIAKNEVLSELYAQETARREADAALEKKVNDILDTEKAKQQAALDALKAKMGLGPQ
ncbi:MAG: hypothetical protein MUC97_09310 [Bernardetiaceae bacterium]|jgi:phage shock protein A|nr:hypothetical protein [Bernardetiaceae bacterium]